ncbi:hypothetical protein J5U46_03040 [Micromonospora tulbaghiae]|uniref:Polyketide cyclase / dehydrase and lipid transport n=1 Tax=Micromonospora tulbaghiae TaxID=479978 RepID=A0AAW4JAG9_9ACTN|nr:hypothetical protein [Micromonospora tulbaghiae]MBO4139131.1 hypothetical protein [Micromonospora tulbaghiae]MDX5459211.1 hypothetical protein [Micromonospora tulbaghiae]SCE73856.1 hypothetical protein GA0070562_2158 [Micromonospora tulbaghiae]
MNTVEGLVCFGIVAALIGFFVWQFIETRNAVATTVVDTTCDPAQAIEAVREAFGGSRSVLWTGTSGPGMINMRRRGFRGGVTMSIDIEPHPGGGSRVEMWASRTVEYMGILVNFAGVVNRRKTVIARLLADAESARTQGGVGQ